MIYLAQLLLDTTHLKVHPTPFLAPNTPDPGEAMPSFYNRCRQTLILYGITQASDQSIVPLLVQLVDQPILIIRPRSATPTTRQLIVPLPSWEQS